MLPVPTIDFLALHTGRSVDSLGPFAEQALEQATLLFSVVTKRQEYPADADLAQLAVRAITEMADRFLLEQPHTEVRASPFQSETIGSYSYSKASVAQKAASGQSTGLYWWDLAVDELRLASESNATSGSVEVFGDLLRVDADTGRLVVTGPRDDIDPPYVRIS